MAPSSPGRRRATATPIGRSLRGLSLACTAVTCASLACAADTFPLVPEDPTTARSGRRLRAQRFEDGAGLATFVGFLDEATGEPCAFGDTPAGLRCIPRTLASTAFADAACTKRVVVSPAGGSRYAAVDGTIVELGEVLEVEERFLEDADRCISADRAWRAPPSYEARAIVREVPFDFFGAGERRLADPERLSRTGIAAEDGAWSPGGWWDRELDEACVAQFVEGTRGRCAPQRTFVIDGAETYLDAHCETLFVPGDVPDWRHALVMRFEDAECRATGSVRPLLGPAAGIRKYRRDASGACVDAGASAREGVQLGAEIPTEHLAKLEPSTSGTGRLVRRGDRSEDGRFGVAPVSAWIAFSLAGFRNLEIQAPLTFDGDDCRATWFDGELRCLPIVGDEPVWFAEASCATPVVVGSPGLQGLVARYAPAQREGIRVAERLSTVGDVLGTHQYRYRYADGTCSSPFEADRCRATEVYGIGDPGDVSPYPVLHLVTE